MTQPFGSDYAKSYDELYADKDYEAECDLIERVLRTYGEGKIATILDLGCGTGQPRLPSLPARLRGRRRRPIRVHA